MMIARAVTNPLLPPPENVKETVPSMDETEIVFVNAGLVEELSSIFEDAMLVWSMDGLG